MTGGGYLRRSEVLTIDADPHRALSNKKQDSDSLMNAFSFGLSPKYLMT